MILRLNIRQKLSWSKSESQDKVDTISIFLCDFQLIFMIWFLGRSLWAIALSASLPNEHVLLRPEVKYIGNMHGNEVVGLEILLHLIEYLLTSNDSLVIQLMNKSRIWIMPSMNPDGLEISQYTDCDSVQGRLVSVDNT